MKKKICFIAIMVMSVVVSAQTTQRGITEEYNGREVHTPLGGVELKVRDASTTVSNTKGEFTLNFNTSKPGDKVVVRNVERDIVKDGYEVFNSDALAQWYLSNSKDRFTIVMCKSSRFRELKDKWHKISSESYNRQYQADQKKLKKQLEEGRLQVEEYERRMLDLEDRYYDQLENLDNYIDRFARIDLSKMSEQDSLLVEMLEQGKIDEVIRIYEEQKNVDRYFNAKDENKELEEAKKKIEKKKKENEKLMAEAKEKIWQQIQAYYMVGGEENIAKIDSMYKEMATRDSFDCGAAYEYATFLYQQKKNRQSAEWCKRALAYPTVTRMNRVKLYDLLAASYIHGEDPEQGLKYALASVDSLSKYLNSDSTQYISWCLCAMEHAAVALNMTGRNDEAIAMNDSILALNDNVIKKMGEADFLPFYDGYTKTKVNQISMYVYYNAQYEKALSMTDDMLKESSEINERYKLELTQSNLFVVQSAATDVYTALNQLAKADSIVQCCIAGQRELFKKNNSKYAGDLSSALLRLGIIQFYQNRNNESKTALSESVALSRKFCNMENNKDIEAFAMALNNVGYLCYVMGDFAESEKYLKEAASYSDVLLKNCYGIFSFVHSLSYINLFATYSAEEKLDECASILGKMVETADYNYKQRGASYNTSYVILKKELARYYAKTNDIARGKTEIDQALTIDPNCLDADAKLAEFLRTKGVIK